jgi:hypothetical protein
VHGLGEFHIGLALVPFKRRPRCRLSGLSATADIGEILFGDEDFREIPQFAVSVVMATLRV